MSVKSLTMATLLCVRLRLAAQYRDIAAQSSGAARIYERMAQHLYFIRNQATRLIKIGVATDVEARRVTLERMGGARMVVLGVIADGWTWERRLHAAFHPARIIGEWFQPTRDLLKVIGGEYDLSDYLSCVGPREQRAYEVIG